MSANGAEDRGEAIWRWLRWTRWPVSGPLLALAVVTIACDVLTAWEEVSLGALGRVPISPALPIGVLLAWRLGLRRLGVDRTNRGAWREFTIGSVVALVFSLATYSVVVSGGPTEAFGLVLAALGEELVYRLAALLVIGALCAKILRRNWRNAEDWGTLPGVTALVVSGAVFTLLPGHVAQISDTLHALPFISLGVVLGYAVLRTGALIPATVVHAFLNLTTIATVANDSPPILRTLLAAATLVALIAGTVVAGLRIGVLRKLPAVFDPRTDSPSGAGGRRVSKGVGAPPVGAGS